VFIGFDYAPQYCGLIMRFVFDDRITKLRPSGVEKVKR